MTTPRPPLLPPELRALLPKAKHRWPDAAAERAELTRWLGAHDADTRVALYAWAYGVASVEAGGAPTRGQWAAFLGVPAGQITYARRVWPALGALGLGEPARGPARLENPSPETAARRQRRENARKK